MALVIHNESHIDHALTLEQLKHLLVQHKDKDGFFIATVELPEELGTVPCGLHGPACGDEPISEDEVSYEPRGERKYNSRLCNREPKPSRQVTVIAGPHDGLACVLFTAFGGPLSPKEPNDPTLEADKKSESEEFWAQHALSK